MAYENILRTLTQKQLIMPYLENQILSEKWPLTYPIIIDSSPYYGLNPDGTVDGYFHPSTHSLLGERELYYRLHPEHRNHVLRPKRSMMDEMTLAMGSALHGVLQTQLQMIKMVPPENIEVEYIIEEHHVRGRIDWIFPHPVHGDVVTEMKTRNAYAFKTQTTFEPEWDAQLSLAEYSQGKTDGLLLLVESGWPYNIKEMPHQRNDALLEEIFYKFDYVRECIAANEPPRHCCPMNSATMSSCPAKFMCWLKP
jgi:hypothetical protein